MPLPDDPAALTWPPLRDQEIHDVVRRWNAWYVGDRELLAQTYGGPQVNAGAVTHVHNGVPHRGGIAGAAYRAFWGAPVMAAGQQPTRLHVPAAADIAQTGAELVFSEPPTLTVDKSVQDAVDDLFRPLWDGLLDAASLQGGLGGVFLRAGWDRDASDRALLSNIGPDYAVPRFRWGRLNEVTFTWILDGAPSGKVWRHLELHTVGRVEHALYEGSGDKLGRRIPLESHPDTELLAGLVDPRSSIPTELPMLDVIYVPNRTATGWRGHPVGSNLGQADIAVVERAGDLDALDEAWSSWQRDIRLGKARAITSQAYLESRGPGRGAWFDMDQELFVGMNTPPTNMPPKPVELIQAEIRWEAHQNTCMAWLERCVDGSGYSAQTFGLTGEVAMTATESNARERKTNRTRKGKISDWSRAIPDLCELLMAIEQKHLGGKTAPTRPDVEFPPAVRDSIETLARTVALLDGSMSTYERVGVLHPTWDDKQRQAEVDRIHAEQAARMPTDPFVDPDDNPALDR